MADKKRLFLLQPDKRRLLVPQPNKKWLLEPGPLEPMPLDTHCKPWYRDRDKLPSNYLAKHRNRLQKCPTSMDSRLWTFVREGLDDFRTGCPPCDNLIIRRPREGFIPTIAHRPRPPPRKSPEKLPKGELLSKLSPAQKARKAFVEKIEANLTQRSLAGCPNLGESLPADISLKVLEVLDPDRKLEDTWASCESARHTKKSLAKLYGEGSEEAHPGSPDQVTPPGSADQVKPRFSSHYRRRSHNLINTGPPAQVRPIFPIQFRWRSYNPISLRALGQVKPTSPSQLRRRSHNLISPGPPGQVKPAFPGQFRRRSHNQVTVGPPGQVSPGPPDQVSPGPPGQVKPAFPGQFRRRSHNQVTVGPPGQVSPGPPDQVSPGPSDQATLGPPNQVNLAAPDQVTLGPSDELNPESPGKVHPEPPDEANLGAPDKVDTEPPKESLLACINRLFPETKRKKKKKKSSKKPLPKGLLDSQVPREVRKFCKWLETFGDLGIDEAFIMKQFEIDYKFVATYNTGKIKKVTHLPLELNCSKSLDDITKRKFSLQEGNWERKLWKPPDPYKPKRVKIRYGAWYLNPKSWKKLINDEPLMDPKVVEEEEYWNYRRHLEPDIIDELYGPIAFKDFIISKGYRMPSVLEKMFLRKKWTYDSVKTPIHRVMKLLSQTYKDTWEGD